jgi:hypothetical protein
VYDYREAYLLADGGFAQMPDVDRYFEAIDSARIRRIKELSEIKRRFAGDHIADPSGVSSKAAVVLTYANWEGFYNECLETYVEFLKGRGRKVRETDWMLLVCAFHREFESLRDKNHSAEARRDFVDRLKDKLECDFEKFDSTAIEAKSNLNFRRLAYSYSLMNFDLSGLQKFRLRLDKELVDWRHRVAHGDSPDLSAMDISDHVDFAAGLLIVIADNFQYAMLERV